MKSNYFLLLLLFPVASPALCQTPGGVTGMAKWIKPELRKDATLSNRKPETAQFKVTEQDGLLNYNPILNFKKPGTKTFFPMLLEDLSQATVFTVYEESDTAIEYGIWKLSGTFGYIQLTTEQLNGSGEAVPLARLRPGSATINTYTRYWRTDKIEEPEAEGLLFDTGDNSIALSQAKVAEFILYDKVLKASEQRKVESYLAIKYGITLDHDYVSSNDRVIWPAKNNLTHRFRIIGIGRDDDADLLQKQSVSTADILSLRIGAGNIATSNKENEAVINNNDFLIVGDDDKELILENPEEVSGRVPVLKRRWLMNVSGESASGIPTELKINISKVFQGKHDVKKYVLLIDRSGTGNFSSLSSEKITADDLSNDGVLTFKNIYWDQDHSGKDIFSFGLAPGINASLIHLPLTTHSHLPGNSKQGNEKILLYPNPSSQGYYHLSIQLKKPSPLRVEIFDESGQLVQTISRTTQRSCLIEGRIKGSAGVYTFLIQTADEKVSRTLVVQ